MFPRTALFLTGFLAGAAVYAVLPRGEREDLRQADIVLRRAFQEARVRAVESGRPELLSFPRDIPLPGGLKFGFSPRWIRFSPLGSMEVDPESHERRPHACDGHINPGCICTFTLGEIGIWNAQGWALFLFLDRPGGRVGESWYAREGRSLVEDWVFRLEALRDRMPGLP